MREMIVEWRRTSGLVQGREREKSREKVFLGFKREKKRVWGFGWWRMVEERGVSSGDGGVKEKMERVKIGERK